MVKPWLNHENIVVFLKKWDFWKKYMDMKNRIWLFNWGAGTI